MANHYEFKIICKYRVRQEEQVLFCFVLNLCTKTPLKSPFFSEPIEGFLIMFFISLSNASFLSY